MLTFAALKKIYEYQLRVSMNLKKMQMSLH